jgi:hypothetical protein
MDLAQELVLEEEAGHVASGLVSQLSPVLDQELDEIKAQDDFLFLR